MLGLFFDFKKSFFSEKKKRNFIGRNSIFDIFIGNSCILACDERLRHRVLLKNKLDFVNFQIFDDHDWTCIDFVINHYSFEIRNK